MDSRARGDGAERKKKTRGEKKSKAKEEASSERKEITDIRRRKGSGGWSSAYVHRHDRYIDVRKYICVIRARRKRAGDDHACARSLARARPHT